MQTTSSVAVQRTTKPAKLKPTPAAGGAASPPSSRPKCAIASCKRLVGYTHGSGFLCPFHFVRLPEGTQRVLPYLSRRAEGDAERKDVYTAALLRLASEDDARKYGRLASEELAVADVLTRQLTAFPSFEALLTARGGYWPKLPCRLSDPNRDIAHLLSNFYDREQSARGDARRATRVGSCGL